MFVPRCSLNSDDQEQITTNDLLEWIWTTTSWIWTHNLVLDLDHDQLPRTNSSS